MPKTSADGSHYTGPRKSGGKKRKQSLKGKLKKDLRAEIKKLKQKLREKQRDLKSLK